MHKLTDSKNHISSFRKRFYIPADTIYLDGNSLGLLSTDAENAFLNKMAEWKYKAINAWFEGENSWIKVAEKCGQMASGLVGAEKGEVIMTGTTTVNIHALVSSFYLPEGNKTKILADALNFPSDIYALSGLLKLKNFLPEKNLILAVPDENRLLDENRIIKMMTEETALVFLPSVVYTTGQLLDMQKLTKAAHDRNILIGFDCSHSVGAIPHKLNEWAVDFAVWCSYKYLNGGPGSAAFLYVNKKHFGKEPYFRGWFGTREDIQFDMLTEFIPAENAGRWQISSLGILGSSGIEGSLKMILEAGIENIRKQSLQLTDYLIRLINEKLIPRFPDYTIVTPLQPERRGGHVTLKHNDANRIVKLLNDKKIIVDFRPPDMIRIAPVALYNNCAELDLTVSKLQEMTKEI